MTTSTPPPPRPEPAARARVCSVNDHIDRRCDCYKPPATPQPPR